METAAPPAPASWACPNAVKAEQHKNIKVFINISIPRDILQKQNRRAFPAAANE